jgi:hypothetical protein
MTSTPLQAALRAGADGLYALEAGTGLIIAHGCWAERCDLGCFIHHGTATAAIDWEATITALDAGLLPASGGEKRMLRLAASLAGDIPVQLGDAVTGIDTTSLMIERVQASGEALVERVACGACAGSGTVGVQDLPAAVVRIGLRPGDPVFVAPDGTIDRDLLDFVRSSEFRNLERETKRNYATDIRPLLTFLSSRGPVSAHDNVVPFPRPPGA